MEFAVDLAMITINRGQENYVHRTLESLFWCSRKLPLTVHLFVGDADLKYLERYRSDCRIRIHSPSEAEMEQMESIKLDGWRRMNYRCIVNYHRALQLEASRPDAFLVTFEDDVLFAPDFWPRLEATVMEAGVQTDRYVVTFYSTHDAPCSAKSTTLVPYPDAEGFYGNQCLFLSAACSARAGGVRLSSRRHRECRTSRSAGSDLCDREPSPVVADLPISSTAHRRPHDGRVYALARIPYLWFAVAS